MSKKPLAPASRLAFFVQGLGLIAQHQKTHAVTADAQTTDHIQPVAAFQSQIHQRHIRLNRADEFHGFILAPRVPHNAVARTRRQQAHEVVINLIGIFHHDDIHDLAPGFAMRA